MQIGENPFSPNPSHRRNSRQQSLPPYINTCLNRLKGRGLQLQIRQDQPVSRSAWTAAGRKALLESRWELEF